MHKLVTFIRVKDSTAEMNSSVANVMHPICGQPVLSYILDVVNKFSSESVVLTLERLNRQVIDYVPEGLLCISKVDQDLKDKIVKTRDILIENKGTALVLGGDIPTITKETLELALKHHLEHDNLVTCITPRLPIKETHFIDNKSGIFLFNSEFLIGELNDIGVNNFLFDLPGVIDSITYKGIKIDKFEAHPDELIVVHNREQLCNAEKIILNRIIRGHMKNGVTFHLPETSIIHANVKIGKDTVIYPGTIIEGNTVIGCNCEIGPYSRINESTLGNGVKFSNSVITESRIGDNTIVGPFAYIRPGSNIGKNIKIGDFVEIKNSNIGDATKVSHLTYIGDADVGENVNFGCGTVFVNYDGKKKHRTIVGNNAFIGCNVNLVSPVVIKDHAYIAAGSTITEEVPEYALAIARSRQTIIADWVKRKGL